ncbi:MAG: hypothetical protein ACE5R6_18040 [Candidatus Heimdallarchaeota archaeon]
MRLFDCSLNWREMSGDEFPLVAMGTEVLGPHGTMYRPRIPRSHSALVCLVEVVLQNPQREDVELIRCI